MNKFIIYFVLPMLALILLVTGGTAGYITWQKHQIRSQYKIEASNGIQELKPLTINGTDQWISIRGQNRSNPVMLFLHGGPGGAAMPRIRYYLSGLEQHFTVVNWDQRGAGKSYSASLNPKDFTVDQFIEDALEVTTYLRSYFNTEKIYLMGHSWGSMLGILTVYKEPGCFHAFIGTGQAVDFAKSELTSYSFALEEATSENNREAINQLLSISPIPYPMNEEFWHKFGIHRQWLGYYGGMVHGSKNLNPVTLDLFAPEYTLFEFLKLRHANYTSAEYLWDELMTLDLRQLANSLDVPVYILQGRYDQLTPSALALEYFELIECPHKEWVWFENSAHSPLFEEPDLFISTVISILS